MHFCQFFGILRKIMLADSAGFAITYSAVLTFLKNLNLNKNTCSRTKLLVILPVLSFQFFASGGDSYLFYRDTFSRLLDCFLDDDIHS